MHELTLSNKIQNLNKMKDRANKDLALFNKYSKMISRGGRLAKLWGRLWVGMAESRLRTSLDEWIEADSKLETGYKKEIPQMIKSKGGFLSDVASGYFRRRASNTRG